MTTSTTTATSIRMASAPEPEDIGRDGVAAAAEVVGVVHQHGHGEEGAWPPAAGPPSDPASVRAVIDGGHGPCRLLG